MIKAFLPKGWLLFLVITTALGLAGGGYAAWTTSLHVEGTVQTGSVDALWDMQEDNKWVGVLDPATGQLVRRPVPADKDVAECFSDLEAGQTARTVGFRVVNAYPSFTCEIIMGGIVTGSVPVHVARLQRMATDANGNNVLGTELNVGVRLTRKVQVGDNEFTCDQEQPLGLGSQLHQGDRFCAIIHIHANQSAKQDHAYKGGVWIELIQWNLAAPGLPPDLPQLVGQRLAGDVFAFNIVDVNPQIIAILIGLAQGDTAQVTLPAVSPQPGPHRDLNMAAMRFQLRDPELDMGTLKPENREDLVQVQLAPEQNFTVGECVFQQQPTDPPHDVIGIAPQQEDELPPLNCGALSVIDAGDVMVSGVVIDRNVGVSFMEPVNLLLQTRDFPGLHVVYNTDNTVNPFTDDEEPELEDQIGQLNQLLSKSAAGLAAPALSHTAYGKTTKIVLDGDRTFYQIDPATWPQRMESVLNTTRVIYNFIEPFSFSGWSLNMQLKGMEVWVSGGPTTTDGTALINELTATNYFLINQVNTKELHYFFVGYNVAGLYGKAAGIGSTAGFGGRNTAAKRNSAFGVGRAGDSHKTKVVVQAHELGHLLGGTHGAGATSGCAGGFFWWLCGPSLMPAGSAGAPDTRKYYMSSGNDTQFISVLNAVLP